MRKQMIISVMSKDRPGIIASITGAIYRLGGDVADLNQTVLCGYLTMILSVSFEPEVTKEDLLAAISHIKTDCKFEVSIKEIAHASGRSRDHPPETYILTVQGPNKAGIVHGISQFCFEHNINILDLATTLKNNQYTMALQLDLTQSHVLGGNAPEGTRRIFPAERPDGDDPAQRYFPGNPRGFPALNKAPPTAPLLLFPRNPRTGVITMLRSDQILATVEMIQKENLDVRTVTMGINLLDCRGGDIDADL